MHCAQFQLDLQSVPPVSHVKKGTLFIKILALLHCGGKTDYIGISAQVHSRNFSHARILCS